MRPLGTFAFASFVSVVAFQATAKDCDDKALGTSRTLSVPVSYGPVGTVNYHRTLPLERGEVVLTFDDGPLPGRTPAVLDALRAECVQATFFVVGSMVAQFPNILRRTAAEGHTIATHTWSHRYLNRVTNAANQRDQISAGLLAARAVLGDADPALSPFFRFPGLGTSRALNRFAADRNLIPFSIDVDGDDWRRITPAQVLDRVLTRLGERGRGIILLHDIQPRTVAILPELLRRLKAGGYRVVHVVPEPVDTRLALAAAEAPGDRRMQLALANLERAGVVSTAGVAQTTEEDAQRRRVATATGEPVLAQVASAEDRLPLLRPGFADKDEAPTPASQRITNAPFKIVGLNPTSAAATSSLGKGGGWIDPPTRLETVLSAKPSVPTPRSDGRTVSVPSPSAFPNTGDRALNMTAAIPTRPALSTVETVAYPAAKTIGDGKKQNFGAPVIVQRDDALLAALPHVPSMVPQSGGTRDSPQIIRDRHMASDDVSRTAAITVEPSRSAVPPARAFASEPPSSTPYGSANARLGSQRLGTAQTAGAVPTAPAADAATTPARRTGFVVLTLAENAGPGLVEISH